MTVEKIDLKNCHPIILDLFREDEDLVNKHHIIAGAGLEACAKRTANDMVEFAKGSYEMYVIKDEEEIVAYFGKEEVRSRVFMTGFYVKIKYRTKEFISYFWHTVGSVISERPVYSCIYANNTKAADFLSKKGTIVLQTEEVLTFKIF